MIDNNHNFKLHINWETIAQKEQAGVLFKDFQTRLFRGISDQVYIYFLCGSKQNPEKISKVDMETGEVKEVYKEPFRYLYCSSFSKIQAAKEMHISRPTLDKHLAELFAIGLIEEGEKYNKEKKKNVKVWRFPHFKWTWCIDAKVCSALTEIGSYKTKEMKKGTMFHGIVRLLFELKRIVNLTDEKKAVRQSDLLKAIVWQNNAANRLRLMDYMVLLQGLDLIDFDIIKKSKGSVTWYEYQINYVNDKWNNKIERYLDLIRGVEINDFIDTEKIKYHFDIANIVDNY